MNHFSFLCRDNSCSIHTSILHFDFVESNIFPSTHLFQFLSFSHLIFWSHFSWRLSNKVNWTEKVREGNRVISWINNRRMVSSSVIANYISCDFSVIINAMAVNIENRIRYFFSRSNSVIFTVFSWAICILNIKIVNQTSWIWNFLCHSVYPNQQQPANYMMNHMPMQQQPHHPHSAQPHFYQVEIESMSFHCFSFFSISIESGN